MSEEAPRLSSLSVLGGPLHGKTLNLSKEAAEILIGSAPSCGFRLQAPGVAPRHARIVADETGAAVFAIDDTRGVYLNFEKVEGRAALADGDVLRLGPPQDKASVMLQLEFGGELTDAPTPAGSGDDDLLIADLHASDDAFVLSEDPVVPAAPPPVAAVPAAAPPIFESDPVFEVAAVEDAHPVEPAVAADEFFVAAEAEAPAPPPVVAPPAPPPAAPAHAPPPSAIAFDATDDFALPSFDPNWSSAAAPAPAPPPMAAAAADEFFVGDEAPSAPAAAPSSEGGLNFATDDQPLAFDSAASAPPAAAHAAARATPSVPARAAPVAAPTPAPVAAKPAEASADAPAPARPRPARRPPGEEGAPAGAARPRAAAVRKKPAPAPPIGRYAAMGGGGLLVVGAIVVVAMRFVGSASITSVEPSRAKVGQTITVTGGPFSNDPAANEAFFGDKPSPVLESDGNRLKVQVPDVITAPGQDAKVSLKIRVAGKDSRPFTITVFGGPTVVGISPDVAMPGEEVVLAGTGWGAAPTVRFGEIPAEILQVATGQIRVRVPDLAGGPGTAAAAVVKDGPAESNPAPFFLGRIPLLVKAEPENAVAGDLVTLSGRGFRRELALNAVTLGGARALVTSAIDSELRVVAPFNAIDGAGGLELRVPGSENVARAAVTVLPPSDVVEFRFAAQPFDAVPGREHAVLWTGLGPAFVLAASGGKSAAERAFDVQHRLNEAGTLLKASRALDIELRNPDSAPVLGLVGRPEVLLEVTDEDVAAYNEDWTGLKGRGGPVTRLRLGQWWAAVAKDLVLMLVRGARPTNAPALATEGRTLIDVSLIAQRTGRFGVPWSVVTAFRPPQKDALRLVALRVPASVVGPGGARAAASTAVLKLEGSWVGSEMENAQRRYISATFGGGTGSVSIEAAVTLTLPLLTLETRRNETHFSIQFRGGIRHYVGKWDGHLLTGTISTDAAGKEQIGTFELKPR